MRRLSERTMRRTGVEGLERRVMLADGGGLFQASTSFAVGARPVSVTAGDFNGDGKRDLAVANTEGNTVSILLGNGDGTFQSRADYEVGRDPQAVIVGDFDGDGRSDLAVANGMDNTDNGTVSILLGNGDGTFQSKADYVVGKYPESLSASDFNGDGKIDLAVTDLRYGQPALSVLLGNGDGTFQSKIDHALDYYPIRLISSDFNGDGKSDLAVTGNPLAQPKVNILLGNGDGTFQDKEDYIVGNYPQFECVTVGDFDGDGKEDLAVTSYCEDPNFGSVTILLGNGDGTFWRDVYLVGSAPTSVTAGDFNGDGKSDLAVTTLGSSTVSILVGSGDGTFERRTDYVLGFDPRSVTAGDFNGDGNSDLAVASTGSNTVTILLGNGDGRFLSKADFGVGSGPVSVTVGDFNGDDESDLVVANRYSSTVSILLGNGDGTFRDKVDYGAGNYPESVTVGDFNGDDKSDLAVANTESNTVSILLGNGDGTFRDRVDYGVGNYPVSVTVGDFNRDGRSDLAVANTDSGTVSILLGNGDGTFQSREDYSAGSAPRSVTVGDFNGDGNSDLAVANTESNTVSILLGNGDGTFRAKVDHGASNSPDSVTVGDLNGDGKSDLVVANTDSGTVSILLGNGDGTFQSREDYSAGSAPRSVTVGDFNGDGNSDLAAPSLCANGTVSILLGNGDGTFHSTLDYRVGNNPVSVTVGDFNGDGQSDLAVANANSETVSILLGVINSSATAKITLSCNSVAENQPAGTVVGSLSATDPDAGEPFTYMLVSGAGSADNACFVLDGNQLKTTEVFNFEVKNSYSVRIRGTDAGGLYREKVLTIIVTNINETPTDVALSDASVQENQAAGTVVGSFSTIDPDTGDTFIYSLASGAGSADNSLFTIDGAMLRTASVLNYHAERSFSVRVRSTDQGGLWYEKAFTIAVAPDPALVRGTFGLVTGRTATSLTLRDEDGDWVRFRLSGGGAGTVSGLDKSFQNITLTGTTAKSVLTIGVKRNKYGGDGLVTIGSITSDGLVKSISGTAVILSGQMLVNTLDQSAGKAAVSLKLRQISDSDVQVQGLPVSSIAVAGDVSNSRIVTTGSIGRFSAATLLDSDILVGMGTSFSGHFAASAGDFANSTAKLGSLKVSGKKLPSGSSHPAYVAGSRISAPSVGTVTLLNVPKDSGAVVHVVNDVGVLKVSQSKLVNEEMVASGTWKVTGVRPPIWRVV